MDVRLPSDFREFLKLLNQNRVEYMVIGGYAVGYHGHPRATKDIDIWVSAEPNNISRVADAVKAFGFDVPELAAWRADPRKALRMGYPPARIEVLTVISGVEFAEAARNQVDLRLDDVPVHLISLSDLRRNKKAAGRPHDLADLENLPPGGDVRGQT
jgi:hypothetical protein